MRTGKRICLDHILFYGCDKTPCQEQLTGEFGFGFVWAVCFFKVPKGFGPSWWGNMAAGAGDCLLDRAPTVRKQGVNRKWTGSLKGLGPPTMLHFLQQGSASFNNLPQQCHLLEATCSHL